MKRYQIIITTAGHFSLLQKLGYKQCTWHNSTSVQVLVGFPEEISCLEENYFQTEFRSKIYELTQTQRFNLMFSRP